MNDFTYDERKRQLNFSDELNLAAMLAVKRYAEAIAEHCKILPDSRGSHLHALTQTLFTASKTCSSKPANPPKSSTLRAAMLKALSRGKGPRIARTDNVGFP